MQSRKATTKNLLCLVTAIASLLLSQKSQATCNWTTYLYDDYEYTTVCPDILPGKTYHNTPMNFRPHAGNLSLYFNFRDTVCLAGDMVYRRYFEVCPNLPVRVSSWICTAFNAPECNIRVRLADGANNTLDDQQSIIAPLFPVWSQYVSNPVISTSGSMYIEIYTNIPGSNGNDLAWDELLVEYCSNYNATPMAINVCSNGTSVSLFSYLNSPTLQTGSWLTTQPLTGGYLGIYNPATNSSGTFVYASNTYGVPPLCPVKYDTLLVTETPSPSSTLFNDTTLCDDQDITLNPGPNFTSYLWSDGSTASTLAVSAPGSPAQGVDYYVTLTASSGCSFTDSISINYVVCAGIENSDVLSEIDVFPNPSCGFLYVQDVVHPATFELFETSGRCIFSKQIPQGTSKLDISAMAAGTYHYKLTTEFGNSKCGTCIIMDY